MPRRRKWVSGSALSAVVAVLVLSGCTNGSTPAAKRTHSGTASASTVGGIQQVTITTGNDLRFHPATIVVHPGKVRIVLKNTAKVGSGPPHNVDILGLPGQVPLTGAGDTSSYVFTAPSPGKYTFVCTIHVKQGQTGTMIVR